MTKTNDAPEGPLFSFKSETHDFGTDADGDPTTVNVVSAEEVSAEALSKPDQPCLTENLEAMLRLLHDAGQGGLSTAKWNARAREIGIGVNRKGDAAQPQSPAQRPQPGSGIQRCLACTEVRLRLRTLPPL